MRFHDAALAVHPPAKAFRASILRMLPARACAVLPHAALPSDKDSQVRISEIGNPMTKGVVLEEPRHQLWWQGRKIAKKDRENSP
jgi:hypothetical protein